MLVFGEHWKPHRFWLLLTLVLFGLSVGWFLKESRGQPSWPTGSSEVGLSLGVAAGAILLFEMFLGIRKCVRTMRIGRVKHWMRAHLWLGLLAIPLAILHTGFRLGGTGSMMLMAVFLIVSLSGLWGLLVQQYLPRKMLEEVPAETIYSQIEPVLESSLRDASRLVSLTCGMSPEESQSDEDSASHSLPFVTVGAVRSAGHVHGKVTETRLTPVPVADSEPLMEFFHQQVVPFIERSKSIRHSTLAQPQLARRTFTELRAKLPPAAHPAVATLEALCDSRRQLDRQKHIHFWLHNWLWIHLPLSVALFFLLIAHVWTALKYW